MLVTTQSGISTAAGSLPAGSLASASPASAASGAVPAALQGKRFTLITGDVVSVNTTKGTADIDVSAAPGREGVGFFRTRTGDDVSVVPADVAPLVASGQLDDQLFNISELGRLGLGDRTAGQEADRSTHKAGATAGATTTGTRLPLIIKHRGARLPAAARAEVAGAEIVPLTSIGSTAVSVPEDDGGDLWKALSQDAANGKAATPKATPKAGAKAAPSATAALLPAVETVWLDRPAQLTDARSTRPHAGPEITPDGDTAVSDLVGQINAKSVRAGGIDGSGVKVAVLDTGVLTSHPDLKDRVSQSANFIEWDDETATSDIDGHGTHVAGIVGGTGAASGGTYAGVAPGAEIISGRVLSGSLGQISHIIAGMEWAAEQGADIVNMSLGASGLSDGTDPWSLATDALLAKGVLPVVSAGNSGPGSYTVTPPAAAEGALSVGAAGGDGATATFSSRGPLYGDYSVKPNVKAPGVAVTSARAAGTPVGDAEREGPEGPVDDNYTRLSGTSMAAPAVAGAAALVMQAHPDWTPVQVSQALISSARGTPGESVYDEGAGLIDVQRAIDQRVSATTPAVDFGRQAWPRPAAPTTRKATFRNASDAPVTLDLSLAVRSTRGTLPSSVLSLSTNRLTVPAHGEASADVVLHDKGVRTGGTVSAVVTAKQSGGPDIGEPAVVLLPVGLTLEPESHELTLRLLDQNGEGASDISLLSVTPLDRDLEPFESPIRYTDRDTLKVRVPTGSYGVSAIIARGGGDYWYESDILITGEPYVRVTKDTALTLGGKTATRLGNTVPTKGVQRIYQLAGLKQTQPSAPPGRATPISTDISVEFKHRSPAYWSVPSRTSDKRSDFTTYYREDLAAGYEYATDDEYSKPTATGPVYYLANAHRGGVPAKLTGKVGTEGLARIDARYAQSQATTWANGPFPLKSKLVTARIAGIDTGGRRVNVKSPGTRTEYYSASPDVAWTQELRQTWQNYDSDDPRTDGALYTAPETLRGGSRRTEKWNYPVAGGPALVAGATSPLTRTGSTLTADLPLTGDSNPRHRSVGDHYLVDSVDYTLSRDGKRIPRTREGAEEFPRASWINGWDIPAGNDTYTLKATAVRDFWYTLSTEVRASWTFAAGATPGGGRTAGLPLSSVRWQPATDNQSRAKDNRRAKVPFTVQRVGGTGGKDKERGKLRSLTVEASYDNGTTWKKVPVRRYGKDGLQGQALLRYPKLSTLDAKYLDVNGDGYVSLRVRGKDAVSSFALTVKKAYKLKAAS
ncbi:hypothetical protein DVK44_20595 [Streptomyces paludis]|uniref:Peptidase S8/S53 domain-containing protein n=2 Tax=Streptomyces paludis TaxID=2282738 RepID=A0A345HSH4_9ACTN|nr:hypothetical protein DVK44_20595 [Streptomyces paludis]